MLVDYKKLGFAISYRRIELGLTQEKLAELCNLSPSHIGCIERADRKISVESLVALCCALEISPNRLLIDSLPDHVLNESLDAPLKLREPDYTLRNTLSNWYLVDDPDESMMSDPPVSSSQLAQLKFMLLGEDFPENSTTH